MINPFSLVTGIVMAVVIGHTYQVKGSVTAMDRELRDIRRATDEVEARTQTLAAEWARLNDQERLRGLADRHLGQMVPMQPTQFARLDEAVRRLPTAVAWAGEASPFAPRQENVALAEAPQRENAAAARAALVTAARATAPAVAAPSGPTPRPAAAAALASASPAIEPTRPPQRPVQLADAAAPARQDVTSPARQDVTPPPRPDATPFARPDATRPAASPAPRTAPVLPEAARPVAPANALPAVAAPPASLARAAPPQQVAAAEPAPRAAPRPPALAAVAAPPRQADSAALPPVRPAMLVQRVDTGSMLGNQAVAMAPPVPWGR